MKINLIIDGNYILNKNLFSLHKHNILYGELHNSLNKTIQNLKSLYYFDNIFFVSDSGTSWRKNIYSEYKAQRKKTSDIDWEFVYTAYKEFKEDLSPNIKILERPSIEGDDWIAKIIFDSNDKGYANIIISNDYDIKQLLKYNLDPLYINIMSNEMINKGKVFLPRNYEIFLSKLYEKSKENDLFSLSKDSETLSFIRRFVDMRDINIADSEEVIITKIISGDTSDNIKSAYQKTNKLGKIRGIGDTGAKKIYDMYLSEFGKIDLNDNDLFDNISDLIREVKKTTFSEMEIVKNRLSDNFQLISLFNIPDHILKQMSEDLIDFQ